MSSDQRQPNDVISLADLPPCAGGLSRRKFCAAAGTGLITLGLAACDGGGARISTGAIDDPNGDPNNGPGSTDMSSGHTGGSPDLAGGHTGGSPDLANGNTGQTCGGALNAGPASAIAVGTGKHFSANAYDLYVCRDANGLFTVDAQCTHAGCDVKLQSGKWYCPCHGARFNFDGTNPTAPAFSPLNNYAVCVDGSGNVIVDYNTVVSPTTRA